MNLTKAAFINHAHAMAKKMDEKVERNFEQFLEFVYDNPTIINKKGGVQLGKSTAEAEAVKFLESYLKANFEARKKRIVLNETQTVPDPAVDVVLEVFASQKKEGLANIRDAHRLSMAAESKIGQLLEAYLATKLEPLGWFWCSSNVIKGVDFFKAGSPDQLLQVKNRSNSENSSSKEIRATLRKAGCPVEIDLWYRIESSTGETWWKELEGNGSGKLASEEGFHSFIRQYNIE